MASTTQSTQVSVQDMKAKMDTAGHNCVFIDVRTKGEYKGSYIHGVDNVPLGDIDKHIERFQKSDAVYVHCHNGIRTKEAVKKLTARGVTAIFVEGGIVAWRKAGFPVVQGSNSGGGEVISVMRQVQVTTGSLVLGGVILSKYVHPEFIWLSGVMGAGLLFTGLSGSCMMAMMMDKMPWNK